MSSSTSPPTLPKNSGPTLQIGVDYSHRFFRREEEGVDVHYIITQPTQTPAGEKKKIPIVFVHGWPEFWYAWRSPLSYFTKLGHRCVAPDLRGMGQTKVWRDPENLENFTFAAESDDIATIIKSEKLDRVVIVGHDWGGFAVWDTARRYPDLIAAVISFSPYFPHPPEAMTWRGMLTIFPYAGYSCYHSENRRDAANDYEKDLDLDVKMIWRSWNSNDHDFDFGPNKENLLSKMIESTTWADRSFFRVWDSIPFSEIPWSSLLNEEERAAYKENLKTSGFYDSLQWYRTNELNWKQHTLTNEELAEKQTTLPGTLPHEVSQPALAIICTHDFICGTLMKIAGMKQSVPLIETAEIDSGHWAMQEKPNEVNQTMADWIQKLEANENV